MIFAKNFARNYEKKNNTWNIRRLVDKSFVPLALRTSVLCCRLTDFNSHCPGEQEWWRRPLKKEVLITLLF